MKLTTLLYGTLAITTNVLAQNITGSASKISNNPKSSISSPTKPSSAYTHWSSSAAATPSVKPNHNVQHPNNTTGRPHAKVDTVNNSEGVPSSLRVENCKHTAFCHESPASLFFCKSLHTFIVKCAGVLPPTPPSNHFATFRASPNATASYQEPYVSNDTAAAALIQTNPPGCNWDAGFYLLEEALESTPCSDIDKGASEGELRAKICEMWVGMGSRCKNKSGPSRCRGRRSVIEVVGLVV
ncbi:hypothetical protein P280DRAFT_534831 [Massarina eburnea CBS 473.64]|uniref:Uncharacterized protein n=1 Tax=Massarina eburnea CBS 473.64 TaxID=1395130 RepID=A0A6A6S969_9PLEO|nr:hypothetical protein P280DRAFT_534831 [Massarina eburnea CBS 473.64]